MPNIQFGIDGEVLYSALLVLTSALVVMCYLFFKKWSAYREHLAKARKKLNEQKALEEKKLLEATKAGKRKLDFAKFSSELRFIKDSVLEIEGIRKISPINFGTLCRHGEKIRDTYWALWYGFQSSAAP